jgi:hypothetical protein
MNLRQLTRKAVNVLMVPEKTETEAQIVPEKPENTVIINFKIKY